MHRGIILGRRGLGPHWQNSEITLALCSGFTPIPSTPVLFLIKFIHSNLLLILAFMGNPVDDLNEKEMNWPVMF